jgi:NAD(P)-dependent dehydrogenase (short-subunit alcohol dehydrogenase family)
MARTTQSLSSKVVAITGGARGIGKATAQAFLDAGAQVAIGDIDDELAAKTAVELGAKPGTRVIGLRLNVTDRASFAQFLDAASEQLGEVDVLVNNAGIMPTGLHVDEDDAMTDRQIDINLRGVITGSKLAARRFAGRGGHIVNIASLAGVVGYPGLATYCATKHAVLGFTEALWGELKDSGIGVSAVLPGVVRTELSAGAKIPAWSERITTVDPEDVAAAVVTAVVTGKPKVVVPKSAGGMLKSMGLMSTRAKFAVAHALKFDVTFTEADPAMREKYHRRITGGSA